MLAGHDVEKREVRTDKDRALAETCEDAASLRERGGVDIETEETTARAGPFEDGLRVATRADRAVEKAATFAGIKLGEYFGQENRVVNTPTWGCPDS